MLTRAITLAAEKGSAGKAMQALEGTRLLPLTDGENGTVRLLTAKYPAAYNATPPEPLPVPARPAPTTHAAILEQQQRDKDRLEDFTPVLWQYLRVRSHRKGGEGMSGWTFAKWALAFNNAGGEKPNVRVAPLAQLVLHFHDGHGDNEHLRGLVTGQRGVALDKGDGSPRPIGILESLTRLVTGTLVRVNRDLLAGHLHPLDFGMLRSGTEATAQSVRLYTRANPGHLAFKLDIKNAFNSLSRHSMFDAIRELPDAPLAALHAMINTVYRLPSTVTYDRDVDGKPSPVVISNEEGVIQGEAMASWLFDFTYSRKLRPLRVQAADSGCFIVTFHDDTYLLGPAAAAFAIYDAFRGTMEPHGLIEQPSKTLVFCRQPTPAVQALAEERGLELTSAGMIVTGTPVGTDEFERTFVNDVADHAIDSLIKLQEATLDLSLPIGMPKVQGVFNCIRRCIPSKVNYLLRSVDPRLTHTAGVRLDRAIYYNLIFIMRLKEQDASIADCTSAAGSAVYARLFLPFDQGGMGLASSEAMRNAAYVGSWASVGEFVQRVVSITADEPALPAVDQAHLACLTAALAELQPLSDQPEAAVPVDIIDTVGSKRPGVQAALGVLVNAAAATSLRESIAHDRRALAALTSSSGESAGAWLTASPALRYHHMVDDDFRIAFALRARAPMPIASLPKPAPACAACGSNQNLHGDHAFSCSHMRRAAAVRHHQLAGAFWWGAFKGHRNLRAYLVPAWEAQVSTLYPARGAVQLRADALVDTTSPGADCLRRKCIDYMVTHPTGSSQAQCETVGVAARAGETGKWSKYTRAHELTKGDVIPVVYESFGTVGPAGDKFIKDLANMAHPVATYKDPITHENRLLDYDGLRADFIRRLRERLAVTLQRANATLLRTWASKCFVNAAGAAAAAPDLPDL